MDRYEVRFGFINYNGEYREDFMNDNGIGFTYEDAKYVARGIQNNSGITVTYVTICRM